MMRISLLLLLSLMASFFVQAQDCIGLKKEKALKKLASLQGVKPDLRYDKNGLCAAESYHYSQKEALENKVRQLLALKKYSWIRINENQYVSSFAEQVLIEIQDESSPYSLQILRTAWTKELYEILLKN